MVVNNNFLKLGCSQGRLVIPFNGELQCFPKDNWKEEFNYAKDCKLDFIELLAERKHNPDNPIWDDEGINLLKKIIKLNNLDSYSACIDYVIDNSLFNGSKSQETLIYVLRFIRQIKKLNINKLVLPLLEKSAIDISKIDQIVDKLYILLQECKSYGIEIVIESVAKASDLLKILEALNNSNLGCVYDTGNRHEISNPIDEIIYLKKHIKHIHIKDKRNKENVVVGTGNVDFLSIFKILKKIKYEGSFCFETNRGNNPIKTMHHNVSFIKFISQEIN